MYRKVFFQGYVRLQKICDFYPHSCPKSKSNINSNLPGNSYSMAIPRILRVRENTIFCQARPTKVFVPGWVWIRTRSLQGITTRCWRKTALDIRSSDGFLRSDQKRKPCKCTLRQITHWLKQQEPAFSFTRLHNSFYLSGPESSLNTMASSCNFSHDSMVECARFCIKLFRLRLSRIDGV
jgi:hypothetical protein